MQFILSRILPESAQASPSSQYNGLVSSRHLIYSQTASYGQKHVMPRSILSSFALQSIKLLLHPVEKTFTSPQKMFFCDLPAVLPRGNRSLSAWSTFSYNARLPEPLC